MKIFHITSCFSTMYMCVHDNNIKTENVQLVYQLAFLLLFRTLSLIFCCTLKSFFLFLLIWLWKLFYCGFYNAVLLFCCCEHITYREKKKFKHGKKKFFIEKLLFFLIEFSRKILQSMFAANLTEKNFNVHLCCFWGTYKHRIFAWVAATKPIHSLLVRYLVMLWLM